jgi:transposase
MRGHNSLLVGIKLFSSGESAYWQAKKRLKETFMKSLTCDIAKELSNSVKPEHLWCGRPVKTIDSSEILMADTGGGSKTWQK